MWDSFSKPRVVVWSWLVNATKGVQYLKGMIRSQDMQKIEIPGLISGIGLIIGTIVILLYSIH